MARPKLIVLGTGFAAFSLIKDIDTDAYDISVVSPRNHFLFTPLLPSTTVGTIEFRSIIEPIRNRQRQIQYYQAFCSSIEIPKNLLRCENVLDHASFQLPYDVLVIAVGAVNNTFNIPGVEQFALFLKELADARLIRQRIIDCFERASMPSVTENERSSLLNFVVVGGGPTGVEFAAEMHDFLVEDLQNAYPRLVDKVQIILLEAADHILTTFDEELAAYTMKHLSGQRINVRTHSLVIRVSKDGVFLNDGTMIPYGLLVWSTGIGPTALIQSLPLKKDKSSRIIVNDYLQAEQAKQIYVLGDCAAMKEKHLPATAQVAQQQGKYLAHSLNRLAMHKEVQPFHYKNLGMLAYIGGRKALADLAAFKGRGFLTWLFWRSAYLTRLVSFKNKILVVFDWLKTFIFGRDISRF